MKIPVSQLLDQLLVELVPDSLPDPVFVQIDRRFDRMGICRTGTPGRSVTIAPHLSLLFVNQIREAGRYRFDPAAHGFRIERFVFESDDRIGDVMVVYFADSSRIFGGTYTTDHGFVLI